MSIDLPGDSKSMSKSSLGNGSSVISSGVVLKAESRLQAPLWKITENDQLMKAIH